MNITTTKGFVGLVVVLTLLAGVVGGAAVVGATKLLAPEPAPVAVEEVPAVTEASTPAREGNLLLLSSEQ